MTWKELLIGIPLAVAGALLLAVTGSGMLLTRTDWGRERVREFALRQLNDAIPGRVEIDGVLEGDLLGGVRMAGVRIYEPDGDEFARVDTITVRYRWSDFLIGNITLPEVELVGPTVTVVALPGGRWNFEEVFKAQDADTAAKRARTRSIVLRDVAIRSGDVTLRFPWKPDADFNPDSLRWFVENIDGQWWRVFRAERLNARLPIARVEAPKEMGRLFQITQLTCQATVIGRPFEVEQLRADIEVHEDTLMFDLWEGDLPGSRLFGEGWVKLSSDLQYDITLRGNPVIAEDFTWLIPQLPPGNATLDLRYRSLQNGFAMEAQNARWESPDAELSGRFAMSVRDRSIGLQFDGAELDVQRLGTPLISWFTGWEPPLAGDLSGYVSMDGPLTALRVDADARFQPQGSSDPSLLSALGIIRFLEGALGARDLELRSDTLQAEVLRAFVPLAIGGRVSGRARLDGTLAQGLALDFDLQQEDGNLAPTKVGGQGTVASDGRAPLRLDLSGRADLVSLSTLSHYYPVIPFRGDFSGDYRLSGALDDLDIEARLRGAGDSLRLTGNLRLVSDEPRYRAEIEGWRIKLAEFREGLPQSDLDFSAEFLGRGATLRETEARGQARLSASFVGGVQFDSAAAVFRIENSRLVVDSSIIKAEFGELVGSGALSLVPDESDSLRLELRADSLGGLNPWLFPTYELLSELSWASDLSAAPDGEAERAGLEGSARFQGWLVRDRGSFALRGDVEASRFAYGSLTADSVRVTDLEVGKIDGRLNAGGELSALQWGVGEFRFARLDMVGALVDTIVNAEFALAKEGVSVEGRARARLGAQVRTIDLDDLTVGLGGSTWLLTRPAEFHLEESGAMAVREFELTSGPRQVVLNGVIGLTGPAMFTAQMEGVDLADVARLWPDSLRMSGVLQLDVELSGRVRDPVIAGNFEVRDGDLFGVSFTSFAGQLGYAGGEASVDAAATRDEHQLVRVNGKLPLDLELPSFAVTLPERQIEARVEGDSIPISLVAIFTDQLEDIQGHSEAAVLVRGTPKNVVLQGQATLFDGGFRIISSGITYKELRGRLLFKGQVMELRDVSLRGADRGIGYFFGSVNFKELGNPRFDMEMAADHLPAYDQFDARLVMSGNAKLKGFYESPVVTGNLSVVSGVFYLEEIGRRREIIEPYIEGFVLIDTLFATEQGLRRTGNPFLDNLDLDVNVTVERDTWLRSEETNVEIAGDLRLRMQGFPGIYRIDGTLNALRGEYWFFNKRFTVSGGTIEFVGTPGMNPNLRIIALYTVRTQKEPIDIRLIVGGTLENMTLTLESDQQPPIPESDLLSYLLFGRPSYELTRTSEESNLLQDVTAGVPQAFFGYALGSLIARESGIAYVDITRAPIVPTGEGEYRTGLGPALTATQVEVGWYLAPTIFVSVAQQLVGVVRPTVRLEWRLDERLTVRGITEPRFGTQGTLFPGGPDTDLEQSIGLFLFYGWAY